MKPVSRWGSLLVFLSVLVPELIWGTYSAYGEDYITGDSLSRVANAFYVLYSRDPHLGAIGFIWTPLPSLLEMIPLLLWRWIPAMAAAGLASVVVTAFCASGTATLLYRSFRKNGFSTAVALVFVFAYAGNPFVFMYGANGMSEAIFSCFIVWAVTEFASWKERNGSSSLIQIGLLLALGFWTRYESVALGAAMAFCVLLVVWTRYYLARKTAFYRAPATQDGIVGRAESVLTVLLTPAVFSGFVWILLNYLIVGDPLYFLHSGYSNSAFVQDFTSNQQFMDVISSPVRVLLLVARKSAFFGMPLLCILVSRLFTRRLLRVDVLMLLALAACVPAMQAYMLMGGSSYGWLRFFVYPLVVAIAWLPFELRQLRAEGRSRAWGVFILCGLLASSLVVRDMDNPVLAAEEYGSLHMKESQTAKDSKLDREIAQYVDKLIVADPDKPKLVLTDAFSAYPILVNTRHPGRWVITNDRDFPQMLADPWGHHVDYILVSKPKGAVLQVIYQAYPELFEKGSAWTELVKDFDGEFKLYRVTGPAQPADRSDGSQ